MPSHSISEAAFVKASGLSPQRMRVLRHEVLDPADVQTTRAGVMWTVAAAQKMAAACGLSASVEILALLRTDPDDLGPLSNGLPTTRLQMHSRCKNPRMILAHRVGADIDTRPDELVSVICRDNTKLHPTTLAGLPTLLRCTHVSGWLYELVEVLETRPSLIAPKLLAAPQKGAAR
jgi:hypothetical protein